MKKIIFVFAALLVAGFGSVHADDARADALLDRMLGKIRSAGDYSVEFKAYVEEGQIEGRILVSGRNFRITTPEFEIVGNERARYEINHSLEEVVVDYPDTLGVDIFVNPIRVFESAKEDFDASYVGERRSGDRVCDEIRLTPRYEYSAVTGVRLLIERAGGLPAKIYYMFDGLSGEVEVDLTGFKAHVGAEPSDFGFDAALYPDYEVIDFR
jgi:outer membrane lipoprotein-sorting protein